jgi:hypothetical protein
VEGEAGTAVECPECGRPFARPSALGAHRWQAHRVKGTSPQARSRRRVAQAVADSVDDAQPAVDRDALLRIVFPNGIPVRDDVIKAVTRWLDEAELLARVR